MDDHYFDNLPTKEEFDRETWETIVRLIGDYVVAFQEIEHVLKNAIISMLGCKECAGAIVCGELGFRGVLSVFVSLSIEANGEFEKNKEFINLRTRIHQSSEKRNTIVHSTWIRNSINGPNITVFKTCNSLKNGYRGSYIDESATQMREEILKIYELQADLMHWLNNNLKNDKNAKLAP